jgi:acetylornithine deacetylase/succinyl-diaminopimelate desuccinylase family protein
MDNKLQQVLDSITLERVVEINRALIQIRSQNPQDEEQAVSEYIAGVLREAGAQVELQEVLPGRPNVVGTLAGARPGPRFVFNSHHDTVPAGDNWTSDPFGGEVQGGKMYGRGACDAKGPIASMLAACEALARTPGGYGGEVVFTATADEEFCSRGARKLVEDFTADFAIVGEPTGCRVGAAHRGSFRTVVVVEGVAGHSSRPDEAVNAIFKAVPVLQALEAYGASLRGREHPLAGQATCTVTIIRGGEKDNVIPDRCELTVDRRMIPGETDESVLAEIEAAIAQARADNPGLRVRVDRLVPTTGGPSETPSDDPLVVTAQRLAQQVRGRDEGLTGLSGACDMVHFRQIGARAIVLGPGEMSQAHVADEFVEVDQLRDAARIYAALALSMLDA